MILQRAGVASALSIRSALRTSCRTGLPLFLVALVLAMCAACTGSEPPAAPPPQEQLVFGGYGSLTVGATETDVRDRDPSVLAAETIGTCTFVPMTGTSTDDRRPGYLFGADHQLMGVYPPAGARTSAGVGAGDPAGRILAAYTAFEVEWVYGFFGTRWVALVSERDHRDAVIGFVFDRSDPDTHPTGADPAVAAIAGARDFASGFEVCVD